MIYYLVCEFDTIFLCLILFRRQLNQTSYTENKPEMWDKTKLKYKEQISTLSTYKWYDIHLK